MHKLEVELYDVMQKRLERIDVIVERNVVGAQKPVDTINDVLKELEVYKEAKNELLREVGEE